MGEVPVDLQRHGWLGRFPAETETDYRSWITDQVVPLIRILILISVPVWVLLPVLTYAVRADQASARLWWICWANALLLLCALAGTFYFRRQVVLMAAPIFMILSSDHMYLFNTEMDTYGPALVATAAVLWMFLPPFARAPFRESALFVIFATAVAVVFLVDDIGTGRISGVDAWPFFVVVGTAGWLVVGTSLLIEQAARRTYVDEHVIKRQQALLRRYAPPAVADRIEHGDASSVDAPQRRRVTVLFSDIVGFTELADRLDPESLTQVVNEYLAALAEIIERHNGTLNEFAGDGVMAIFGAPTELEPEQQALAAVAAAREVQGTLPDLNRAWRKLGVDRDLQTRIGINTGVLSVGSFGSEGRATYTGIGLQTNIAARIQSHSEPGTILLSQTSWELVKDTVECEPRGEVTVKGVHFPIAVFAPRS